MEEKSTSLIRRFRAFVQRRVVFNLALLARRSNRHTTYIAVTGSSAKTTTCALLEHILARVAPTAARVGNNTMPSIAPFLRRVTSRHDFAVIEAGIDGPDRMYHLARLIRPHVGIITMVALEHRRQMRKLDVVAAEKGILVEHLAQNGIALLNADDEMTKGIEARTKGQVITFGRNQPADYQAIAVSADFPSRLSLQIKGPERDLEIQTQLVGEHFWLPVTAAVACASHLGVAPETIAQRVASFLGPSGRCSVLELPEGRTAVLDTYKAPQHSIEVAFDVVRSLRAPRRRIVLGQMSDTTGSSQSAYRRAYRLAREAADEVIFVGEHAHRHNASAEDIATDRARDFRHVREAADYLKETAVPGEVILFKANSKLHLERAALAQIETVACWESNCGLKYYCKDCNFYENPRQQRDGDQVV